MIRNFEELISAVKGEWTPTIAVAAAHDEFALGSLREAADLGLAKGILVGNVKEIKRISREFNIAIDDFELIDCPDKTEASHEAVRLIREGRAQALMKGLVDTSIILKAVLNRDTGIRKSELLSHVGVFEIPTIPDRLIYVTDAAISMYPDLETKKRIIENALTVTNALGNTEPVVACVCALEKVNPHMQATVDAAALREMYRSGELTGCRVAGPVALDNALFREAAIHKGVDDPNAGFGEILLVPTIDVGNILYKSFSIVMRAKNAGVVVGAKAPVIMTSRVDPDDTKLNAIALAIRIALRAGKADLS